MTDYGVSFAPTRDNAAMGQRNGQLSGVPQAVQVLSLALPRVTGARAIAPTELLTSKGGEGIDPIAGSVLQTLMKLFGRKPGQPGMPEAGGANPFPGGQMPGGGGVPDPRVEAVDGGMPRPIPSRPLPTPDLPEGVVTPLPPGGGGGGWTPGAGPYRPRPLGASGGRFRA